jgi:hypothetical protein
MEVKFVDETEGIHDCLASLYPTLNDGEARSPGSPSVAIDFQRANLGRGGQISIMQLYPADSNTIWIVDITNTLGEKAFDEKDEGGHSLRGMLEDKEVKKVNLLYF